MKLPKNIEYAIFAIKYLSENKMKECISSKEISDSENIPFELLSKILQKLTREKIIVSIQGIKGGYQLLRDPEELSLMDISLALDQNIQITNCMFESAGTDDCARVDNCCIRGPMAKIQEKLNLLFRETKLIEIIN